MNKEVKITFELRTEVPEETIFNCFKIFCNEQFRDFEIKSSSEGYKSLERREREKCKEENTNTY